MKRKFKDGDTVIYKHGIKDGIGKITFEDDTYFLCQNEMIGNTCDDKKGYKHSWRISMPGGLINLNIFGLDGMVLKDRCFVREF